jgi:hypothetical protein
MQVSFPFFSSGVDSPGHVVDHEEGIRLTIPEIKVIVKDDPSLLEGYTMEEEVQMLADLEAKRNRKCRGTRANNISVNADIKHTMAHLVEEVCLSLFFLKKKNRILMTTPQFS